MGHGRIEEELNGLRNQVFYGPRDGQSIALGKNPMDSGARNKRTKILSDYFELPF